MSLPGPHITYWGGDTLYVNLTSRCSAACTFCLRTFTSEVFGYDLHLEVDEEPQAQDVTAALDREATFRAPDEVVFVGLGEPTLALDAVLAGVEWAHVRRLRTRLDTNGQGELLNPGRDVVGELVAVGLDAVSVSLNAHDEPTYDLLCRPLVPPAFGAVTGFIRRAVAAGLEVTASVVDLPEVDKEAAATLAAELGASFRVRRLLKPEAAA
jgi:TatD family-associated radical SAM protein